MAKGPAQGGIYTATYSNIPVWEFQFGDDNKEHVMRRRQDDWINATHILKACGFDKPVRTRVLEREVQNGTHEKIQGGYGKYQGTWIPLEDGKKLAEKNGVYDKLHLIFEYEYKPGEDSPPPAPRHTSKPKAPKAKPAVPKWNSKSERNAQAQAQAASFSQAYKGVPPPQDDFDGGDSHMHEDDTPDNVTVGSASYMGEDDMYEMSQFSTGHRKRKREDVLQDQSNQQHALYGDELLDYFLLSQNEKPSIRPDPPTNFQPDWPIDNDKHTALHWASAMGDVDIIKQLKRHGANTASKNVRGETPFMRTVNFTNCFEKQTFPLVMKELFDTVDARDLTGCTVIHHAAVMKSGRVASQSCSRYYLDNILNKLQESHHPDFVQQLLDAQDHDGNTAVHLAAKQDARKCVRALIGRGASTDIANNEGILAEDLIKQLNAKAKAKSSRPLPQRSSSPFAPDSQRHGQFRDAVGSEATSRRAVSFRSEAANMVNSRMSSLVLQKFQDLAYSYDDELKEKDDAEKEATRILNNTQVELASLQAQIADIQAQLEPDDKFASMETEINDKGGKTLDFVTKQRRIIVREEVKAELGLMANGDGTNGNGQENDSPAERLRLASQLRAMLQEQDNAEMAYVDARSVLGTEAKIEKYRHLLDCCLPSEDHQMLDENLDDMIKMMQDETEALATEEMQLAAL